MLKRAHPASPRKHLRWAFCFNHDFKKLSYVVKSPLTGRDSVLSKDYVHSNTNVVYDVDSLVLVESYLSSLNDCIEQRNPSFASTLHSLLIKDGLELNSVLFYSLIRAFSACGLLPMADQIFNKLYKRSTFDWGAIISAHVKNGSGECAIQFYYAMVDSNDQPDKHIFVTALQAAANVRNIRHGNRIFLHAVKCGFDSQSFVVNAAMYMYIKCSYLDYALMIFNRFQDHDVISCNVIIEGCVQNECYHKAFQLFHQMQTEGTIPDKVTCLHILKTCTAVKAIQHGMQIHLCTLECSLDRDAFICTALIDMYHKCGRLQDAYEVFTRSRNQDAVTLRAMIAAYSSHGYLKESIDLFCKMQKEGLQIGKITYESMVRACCDVGALSHGQIIHSSVVECGMDGVMKINDAVISLYVKCGSLENAQKIFDGLQNCDVMTWTVMIGGYVEQGKNSDALKYFRRMCQEGIKPDGLLLDMILKICVQSSALGYGTIIHNYITENGLQLDSCISRTLIDMYIQFELDDDAQWILSKSLVEILEMKTTEGSLTLDLSEELAIIKFLQSCSILSNLQNGQLLHSHIVESGFEYTGQLVASLIDMYSMCGNIADAKKIFDTLQNHDNGTWCALIRAYAQHGNYGEALKSFNRLQQQGIQPDQAIFISTLKACHCAQHCKIIHVSVNDIIHEADTDLKNTVIDVYGKCNCINDAQLLFNKLSTRDIVTWNSLISAYACNGDVHKASQLLEQILKDGFEPESSTFNCLLKAITSETLLWLGKLVHSVIYEIGLEHHILILNSLMNMYVKCGSICDAEKIFNKSENKNQVSWGLIISGHAQRANCGRALDFLWQMQKEGVLPNHITILGGLKACSNSGSLAKGMILHSVVILCGYEYNTYLGNALIDMYSQCGSLDDAQRVFTCLTLRTTITWNAMIGGCSKNNKFHLAQQYLTCMQSCAVKPNAVTYICLLSACSRMGLVADGLNQFHYMAVNHGVVPTAEHYNCIIDLFGRAGYLVYAEELLCSLPYLCDNIGWTSLLSQLNIHAIIGSGNQCLKHVALSL